MLLVMNKFIDFIISFSLKRKYLIICLTILTVVLGVMSFRETPVDAFPEIGRAHV